jgi:PAS domain S-box-containing protein
MISNPDLNDISHEVLAAFEKYMKVYFTERDVDKTFAMFDEEMTVIGSAPDEVALDPGPVKELYLRDFSQIPNPVDITYHSIKVDVLSPTIGLVKALISIKAETGNNLVEINGLRLSVIFRRTGNEWRIIHKHISSPTSKYADGESYPIKIEEALRASEDRYHSILTASPDAIFITDLHDGRHIMVSPGAVKMFGCKREEDILGRLVTDFIVPEDRERAMSNFNLIMQRNVIGSIEYRGLRPDGSTFDIEVNAEYIHNAEGKPVSMVSIVRDITQRKRTEEKLLLEMRLLSAIIENIPDQIYYKDLESRFIMCNPAVAINCGAKSTDEMVGKTDFDFFQHDLANQYFDDEQAILKSGISLRNYEEICINKINDDVRWNLSTKVPIKDGNGNVTGLVGINRDITDRKQAEKVIHLKNEELIKLNAEKDKFFSIIAHDLRSPFNSFLGFTGMMVEDLPTLRLDEIQQIALSMRNSATNLFRLLENLLQWSQMEQGLIPFNPGMVQLYKIMDENLALVQETFKTKEIKLINETPPGLEVFADRNMLQTVIRNLISNALKFTPKGGNVVLSANDKGDKGVEISIKDSGIGMSRAMVENLFCLDVQTTRAGTEHEPSSGLGLYLCKDFVNKHGGTIWVESEVGKGSTFHFTLPGKVMK